MKLNKLFEDILEEEDDFSEEEDDSFAKDQDRILGEIDEIEAKLHDLMHDTDSVLGLSLTSDIYVMIDNLTEIYNSVQRAKDYS